MRTISAILASTLLSSSAIFAGQDLTPADSILEKVVEPASPKNILVLLEQGASEALLEVKGSYFLFNPHDGSKISSGVLGKRFMIHATETGLKWGEEFPGFHQIYLQPRSNETSIFINGIQYAGSIAIYAIGNRINIVNDIDIESYVKGLLSLQITHPLENEVMAALAILARTNAYYAVSRHQDAFWQVSAGDIGYQGNALVGPNSAIEKAVNATRHLILVHPMEGKNLPFATLWTEHSAGKTAPYHTMFRSDGWAPPRGVDAPHAALDRKDSRWSFTMSKKAFAQLLELSEIKGIELFTDCSSNKVYALRVKDGIETHDFSFLELQRRLGRNRLQSSDFTLTLKEDSAAFTGYGKGIGVGLCIYSASAMAQNGDSAVKILSKFFPDTYLLNLNALPGKRR